MTPSNPTPLTPRRFLLVWAAIGLQSFGGGSATLTLIRQAVDRYGWITPEEFSRDWALVQIVPGINLIAFTILIGRKVGAWWGIALGLAGLLLPASAISVALTAAYEGVLRGSPGPARVLAAAMRGVTPAIVGLMVVMGSQVVIPFLKASRREGWSSLALSILILIGSALAVALLRWPVVAMLIAGSAVGALGSLWRSRASGDPV